MKIRKLKSDEIAFTIFATAMIVNLVFWLAVLFLGGR
jgi:hypothetical protein